MYYEIETLQEAIEAGLEIHAMYAPNREVVKVENFDTYKPEIMWENGMVDNVDRNDLINFTW